MITIEGITEQSLKNNGVNVNRYLKTNEFVGFDVGCGAFVFTDKKLLQFNTIADLTDYVKQRIGEWKK